MDNNAVSHILVNGFPRSGNNFLTSLFAQAFDENIIFIHHRVDYLSVPNCVVPIRKPEENIPSWARFSETDDIDGIIKWYERFYAGILDNVNNVTIFAFDEFAANPLSMVDYLANKLHINKKEVDLSKAYKNANQTKYDILDDERLDKCKALFNQVYEKRAII